MTSVRYLLEKDFGFVLPNKYVGDLACELINNYNASLLTILNGEMQYGDLIFTKNLDSRYISHVMIGLEGNLIYHSNRISMGGQIGYLDKILLEQKRKIADKDDLTIYGDYRSK